VLLVVCSSSEELSSHPLFRIEKLDHLVPGSLASRYEDDWSRAYYAYVEPGGGGFYIEGSMDAIDDPACGALVIPTLEELARSHGVAMGPGLRFILAQRVFRVE
jgi:hypothetical protein